MINQILLIFFHQPPLVILIEWTISFVTEVFEQPRSETREHNVRVTRGWRHANIDK